MNPNLPEIRCNIGGFVPISTVDWPGYAAAILFLKGCSNRCKDCHNPQLLKEGITVPMQKVFDEIKTSAPFVTALIVSGGEPTKHIDELECILKYANKLKLKTRVQTSGIYPISIAKIIDNSLIDSIALDIKVELDKSERIIGSGQRVTNISDSLKICEDAVKSGRLKDFEVVHTIFPYEGHEEQLYLISKSVKNNTRFVLQQGIPKDRCIKPLTRDQLIDIAKFNIRQSNILIRTRTNGEEVLQ